MEQKLVKLELIKDNPYQGRQVYDDIDLLGRSIATDGLQETPKARKYSTASGLHRTVVARKGDVMDVEAWLQAVQSEARKNEVDGFLVELDGFYILWLIWKEIKR
jgi:ParB-like chromosome segregation protein Spo0J